MQERLHKKVTVTLVFGAGSLRNEKSGERPNSFVFKVWL